MYLISLIKKIVFLFMSFFLKIRSFIATLLFLISTFIHAVSGIVLNYIFNSRKMDNAVICSWGKVACVLLNIKVQLFGLEKLKSIQKGGIILFNHSSFVDVLAIAGYIDSVRFGAKIELFKIPFFGLCMKRFGTLPIARNNKEEVFKVYSEAKARFAKNEIFCLSPEGGRHQGTELSPFKSGPFIFAMNSKVPKIPVVIYGAAEAWPKNSFIANPNRISTLVQIHVLDPIQTEGFDVNLKENRSHLLQQTFQIMNDFYKNLINNK